MFVWNFGIWERYLVRGFRYGFILVLSAQISSFFHLIQRAVQTERHHPSIPTIGRRGLQPDDTVLFLFPLPVISLSCP